MKNIKSFDILFILGMAVLFSVIFFFGNSEIVARASFVIVLAAYFIGKYIGRGGQEKNYPLRGANVVEQE